MGGMSRLAAHWAVLSYKEVFKTQNLPKAGPDPRMLPGRELPAFLLGLALSAKKNKPQKTSALTREKQKQNPQNHTNTPQKAQQKHPKKINNNKNQKKRRRESFALTRGKKKSWLSADKPKTPEFPPWMLPMHYLAN